MMNIVSGTLTVTFDPPFYKGIFECHFARKYQVVQITFGPSEPTTCQIESFLLHRWKSLSFFETSQEALKSIKKVNPKRLQRLASKNVQATGIGTKAQRALNRQHEARKQSHQQHCKMLKDQHKQLIYLKKRQKHLEKHKEH